MQEFSEYIILGNSLQDYIVHIGAFLLACVVIKIFELIILKKLRSLAAKTLTSIDDFLAEIIEKIAIPIFYLAAFYLSLKTLTLSEQVNRGLGVLVMALITFFTVRLLIRIITYSLDVYWRKSRRSETLKNSLEGVLRVTKFIIWALAIIFYLDNLGFKISTVIAGLGIGGVAIALAAQAVLKDLFSYFSIIFDRPFEVGDFVIVGDLLGTVENIGIKTTRIRSLGGEQLVFSNSDLTDSRLRNYKRMQKRRVMFQLGTTYDTSLSKLKEIPKIIGEIIEGVEGATLDRAHFFSYGEFNLIFEVVYYVLSSDYNKYMDIQQEINLGIKGEFEKKKIEFAFPTQTVHLTK
ncbi:MAG: mechanosensitive ion channel family protein [Candidatus Omnitrophica bacterium]|nr:mechanosensitive ion channel family protein [Candidatus Omnitrophota bacterium]